MRVGSSQTEIDPTGSGSGIAVISALAFELAVLNAEIGLLRGSTVSVYQSGPGHERAYDAARAALAAGASALMSWGIAGGLRRGISSGAIILPSQVKSSTGAAIGTDSHWRMLLHRSLQPTFEVHGGELYESAVVLKTAEEKAAVLDATGAVAVDMESAAIAKAAAEAGRPFVAIRVVLDTIDDRLPVGIDDWIDKWGNRKAVAAWTMLSSPRHWKNFVKLGLRYRSARATLKGTSALLVPRNFLLSNVADAED